MHVDPHRPARRPCAPARNSHPTRWAPSRGIRPTAVAALLVAGVQPAIAPARAAAQTLPALVPAGSVGCVACEGPEAFGQIRGLALLADGSVAVLDRDAPVVRIFAPDGGVRATFGRSGEGPGETAWPLGVARAGSDLVVGDMRRAGLTRFAPDGTLLGTRPLDGRPMGLGGDPTGRWIAVHTADWAAMTGGVLLLDSALDEAGVPLPSTAGVLSDDEGRPVAPGLSSVAVAPDGRVAVGHGSEYRIVLLSRDGRRLGEIRRDVERVARSEEEIDAIADRIRRGPAARQRADNPEAGAPMPEVDPLRPHFRADALAWDPSGRLWVRTARGPAGTTVFDVFGPDGRFLGETRVPVALGPFVVGPSELVGAAADPELGVETLHRWRLEER